MRNIDFSLLDSAQLFYSNLGYHNVCSPWKIPSEYCAKVSGHRKELVGSAEQSLYYLRCNNRLEDNVYYQSTTPCFRYDDVIDDLHVHEFYKLELIIFNPESAIIALENLICDALDYFHEYANAEVIETKEGYDIEINGIEVGSYYCKSIDSLNYVCGTGLALPRLQCALKLGYSNSPIKKGELGEISKIKEEFNEFIDAVKQGNPIMGLVELSDLLGSIYKWADKYNICKEDLVKMEESTSQAFKDNVRR